MIYHARSMNEKNAQKEPRANNVHRARPMNANKHGRKLIEEKRTSA